MDDLQEDGDELIFKPIYLTLVFFGLFLVSIQYDFYLLGDASIS
jgi:hypothetical protein